MIDLKRIIGLRPKDMSSASIGESIAQAEAEVAAASRRVAELEAGRGALLLSADPERIERGERDLTEARAVLERATAMAGALRQQLAAAQAAERRTDAERQIAEARATSQAFAAWYRDKYPALADALIEGFSLEVRAVALAQAARQAVDDVERKDGHAAAADLRPDFAAVPSPMDIAWPGHRGFYGDRIGIHCRLPGLAPERPLWPRG